MSTPSAPQRPPFQSPIPAAMAAPAPLTVTLPPLQELSCGMCGTNYEDRGDDVPFCGYGCASGTGNAPPPVAQPTWGWAHRVLPPPAAPPTWGWALRAPPPPPPASEPPSEDAIGCYFCGAPVTVTGPCESCLHALQEDERQYNETCGDCRLKLYDCRCHEDDDYPEDEDDEPPGRICPVCGDRFEGNEWFGVCSRRCARRDR